MRSLAEAWPDPAIVPQLWHYCLGGICACCSISFKDQQQREGCFRAAVEYGWSRNVFLLRIKEVFVKGQGRPLLTSSGFAAPDADLAEQALKPTNNFDFLTVTREEQERDIERGLLLDRPA